MNPDILEWYRVLELRPGAPLDEVKQAHLDLIKVWHPDRFEHEHPRLKEKSEEKIKQINVAYTRLLEHLSNVDVPDPAPVEPISVVVPYSGPVHIKPQYFGGFWGYVTSKGKIAIPPRFLAAEPFESGVACVKIPVADASSIPKELAKSELRNLPGRYGFIVPSGEWAILPRFERAHGFTEGLAAVRHNRQWGYIDIAGAFVIFPVFEDARSFRQDLAAAKANGLWGFIARSGEFVIPPRYEQVDDFKEGWAWVKPPGVRERVKINDRGEMYSR